MWALASVTMYFLLPRRELAALLLELALADLALCITLAKNFQRRLFTRPGFAAPERCAESAREHQHQRHDGGNDQSPEQQHAEAHCAPTESETIVSPHHLFLLQTRGGCIAAPRVRR